MPLRLASRFLKKFYKGVNMVSGELKQIIISKEDSVFWMDKDGNWCNEHGKFEHPKIIKYFNSSLKKDDTGFYVHQKTDECEEKVYFKYEETALFVVSVKEKEDFSLILNDNSTIKFDPESLFIKDDSLYLQTIDNLIKFSSRALLKISKFIEEKNGQLSLTIKGKTYKIS
jgi:hypothetical protein